MDKRTIIVCTCSRYGHVAADAAKRMILALQAQGEDVLVTADFCRMALEGADGLQNMQIGSIIACHERAQSALCQFAKVECENFYNLRTGSAAALLERMGLPDVDEAALATLELPEDEKKAVAWYPAIDYTKCVSCKKCLDFCIFGVYEKDAETGAIRVANPTNCKTNCPACARVCPRGAIVFPKCPEAPINGGEGVKRDEMALEKALQDKNLYKKLAARRELGRKIRLFND